MKRVFHIDNFGCPLGGIRYEKRADKSGDSIDPNESNHS